MRIDHHAYQRATRVAGIGFFVQLVIGLALLVFGLIGKDTTFQFGSYYVLLGLPVWLGLIVIFNQHKLERLEALEEDELAASRERTGSVFEQVDEEIRVAARRLRLMHKWLMPAISLILAASLGFIAFLMLRFMGRVAATEAEFHRTEHIGWAVAICLAFAAMTFIVSRFVAGMAQQAVWRNLRGGAAYMVGNSIVTLALAVGVGFRFFDNDAVIELIARGLPWLMLVAALEIVLNFVLNLYRPRVAGETPRPAFDSRLLSLFAAPDSIVRTINDAVNYQFGFEVTSSWGYQLLLRSVTRLAALAVIVIVVLNMIVIVEPNEKAVKLRQGQIVGPVHSSGIMWKLPWPVETAEKVNVTAIRQLHLTARDMRDESADDRSKPRLWSDDLESKFDRKPDPFIVGGSRLEQIDPVRAGGEGDSTVATASEELVAQDRAEIAGAVSLIDAEIVLQYRIREDDAALQEYLDFSTGEIPRRKKIAVREEAMRSLALREASQYFSELSLNEVLARNRSDLASSLQDRVQLVFDRSQTGIEVVAVNLPLLRPAAEAAARFEELSVSNQVRQETVAEMEQLVVQEYTKLVGDSENVEPILAGIDEYERLREELGAKAAETVAQRIMVEQMIVDAGGAAALSIAAAERDRWIRLMEARGRASRIQGQLISYRAAPRLYRQRELMRVYMSRMGGLRKYVLGVDPANVDIAAEIKELTGLVAADALDDLAGESK